MIPSPPKTIRRLLWMAPKSNNLVMFIGGKHQMILGFFKQFNQNFDWNTVESLIRIMDILWKNGRISIRIHEAYSIVYWYTSSCHKLLGWLKGIMQPRVQNSFDQGTPRKRVVMSHKGVKLCSKKSSWAVKGLNYFRKKFMSHAGVFLKNEKLHEW